MDLTDHFQNVIQEAVLDWMEINRAFLCGLRMRFVGVEGNDLIMDGEIGFASSSTFIRDKSVWQYDGVFILGNANIHSDSESEVYTGTMSCLNELFSLPRPILCL